MVTKIFTPAMLRGAGTRGVPEIPAGSSFSNTYSFNFDGVDENIKVADASDGPLYDIGTGDFTVSIWAADDDTTSGYRQMLFNWSTNGLQVLRWNNGKFATYIGDSSHHISTYDIPDDGSWHHYFVTRNSGACNMYVDGTSVITEFTETGTMATGVTSHIGSRNNLANAWNGNIDEVAIWTSDQTSNLSTIYNSGIPGDLSSLSPINWWRMGDEASWDGTDWTLTDQGSGGHNIVSDNMEEADRKSNVPS
jgi:hypothetical protein